MKSLISAAVLISGCAHAQALPASQPSSKPAGYLFVGRGEAAPSDGFFLSFGDAVAADTAQSLHDLAKDQAIADAELAEHDAENRAAQHEWCARWCFPLAGFGGLVVGGIFGFLAGSHH